MTIQLEFNQEAVAKVERDFSNLQLTPEARNTIAIAAQFYAKFIPISELALRGFIAMTLRDFQVQEKVDASTIAHLPRETRERYDNIIGTKLHQRLATVLIRPEQKGTLEEALNKSREFLAKLKH